MMEYLYIVCRSSSFSFFVFEYFLFYRSDTDSRSWLAELCALPCKICATDTVAKLPKASGATAATVHVYQRH